MVVVDYKVERVASYKVLGYRNWDKSSACEFQELFGLSLTLY